MLAEPTHAEIVASLTARWPEHRVAPSLGRIRALTELLGDPQDAYPVIHLTGTNGKGSTAAMIESLLRADGLRTGRFTSPHVTSVTERITIDGVPISEERFDATWREIEPYVALVDDRLIDGVELTFFEIITAMAYAAFADAPIDVAVVEVGLGGTWDATNVADAGVAVVTPIDLDHTHLLGGTVTEIAREKAGIIKPGAHAILAGQPVEAAQVLLERCVEMGALPQRRDRLRGDRPAARGRRSGHPGQRGRGPGRRHLPSPARRPPGGQRGAGPGRGGGVPRAEGGPTPRWSGRGFADVRFPGRMEVVRRSPTVVLDAAHNPHGARAAAAAITEAFRVQPVGRGGGGDGRQGRPRPAHCLRRGDEPGRGHPGRLDLARPAGPELGELAAGIFGPERVNVAPRLDDALELAISLADTDSAGVPGVLVTGSVVAVGEARTLLVTADEPSARATTHDPDDDWDADYADDGEPDRELWS